MKFDVTERRIDPQGRVMLPKDWREEILGKTRNIVILEHPDYLKLIPKKKSNITGFIEKFEVDLKSDLKNWHDVKRELLTKARE